MGSYALVSADASRLLEIQELDLAIDRLRARLEELESQVDVARAQAEVAEAEARLGELKLSLDAVTRGQRRLESDVDSLEQKVEAERMRLYDGSVANARELQSIEHEVEGLRTRKSKVEDHLLEQMEQREELERQLPPVEEAAAMARGRRAEVEGASASELAQVERDLDARRSERADRTGEVDAELLSLYEDIRRQKKGVGAVALVDGVCMGCHQKLSPVFLDHLKRETGIRRCEYCRRILVVS